MPTRTFMQIDTISLCKLLLLAGNIVTYIYTIAQRPLIVKSNLFAYGFEGARQKAATALLQVRPVYRL